MQLPRTVGEVMTRQVMAIHPNDSLEHIENGMARYRFRHLPVVVEGKLVGLVTHTDIMRLLATPLAADREQRDAWIRTQFKVSTVMSQNPSVATPEMALSDAARTLFEQKLGCLPVVDAGYTLVGIITEADFVRLFMQLATAPSSPPPSAPPSSPWATTSSG